MREPKAIHVASWQQPLAGSGSLVAWAAAACRAAPEQCRAGARVAEDLEAAAVRVARSEAWALRRAVAAAPAVPAQAARAPAVPVEAWRVAVPVLGGSGSLQLALALAGAPQLVEAALGHGDDLQKRPEVEPQAAAVAPAAVVALFQVAVAEARRAARQALEAPAPAAGSQPSGPALRASCHSRR